jgi:hypothetical protein
MRVRGRILRRMDHERDEQKSKDLKVGRDPVFGSEALWALSQKDPRDGCDRSYSRIMPDLFLG